MTARRQKYVWHHELHESWGKERLYFWRLAFFPTYDRTRITEAVSSVMAGNGVKSFALYETLGLYDLVIRVWLPVSKNFQEFERQLEGRLQTEQLQVMDVFTVGSIVRHWPWLVHGSDREMRKPDESLTENAPLLDEMVRGNRVVTGEDAKAAADFVSRKLLAPCPPHRGIKFIIVVTATAQLTTLAARTALREELLNILVTAGDRVAASLYEGSGFGQFLILGGVSEDAFDLISSDLIDPIISARLGPLYGARPYTYVCAGIENPLVFQDELPADPEEQPRAPSARELLEGDEDQKLEVKGSALVNIDRWFRGDGEKVIEDEVLLKGVVRACVALLNTDGGHVVIGAVEADRYSDVDLSEVPRVGNFACIGVDPEFGLVASNWDRYALSLGDRINAAIEPPPTGLFSLLASRVGDRTLAVITVRATAGSWYYVKDDPRLYLREGNATKVVSGPAADAYREAKSAYK